jgi:hypothetical protein
MDQIMTVPENITAFLPDGYAFRRVQIGEDLPAYYQVISSESTTCYIGWSRDLKGSRSSGTSFGPIVREYWMEHGGAMDEFQGRENLCTSLP